MPSANRQKQRLAGGLHAFDRMRVTPRRETLAVERYRPLANSRADGSPSAACRQRHQFDPFPADHPRPEVMDEVAVKWHLDFGRSHPEETRID